MGRAVPQVPAAARGTGAIEPTVNTEPVSLSPAPGAVWSAVRGRSAVWRAWPACSSRGTPVAVVIAVGVAHGERQAGLALWVLLITLPRGPVLEEVRDVADLKKTNGKEGLGTPLAG